MQLEIKIENKEITLSLKDNNTTIDQLKWEENNNLSQILLSKIDEILKKNKVQKKSVKMTVLVPKEQSEFTSSRIAQATANAFNLNIKN